LYTGYTGYHLRVNRSSDSTEVDLKFNDIGVVVSSSDPVITGHTEYLSWLGGDVANIITWYDQSGKGNHGIAQGTVTFDYVNKRVVLGTDGYFSLPDGTVPYGDDPYTMIVDHGSTPPDSRGRTNGTLIYSGKAYKYNNYQANTLRIWDPTSYASIWFRGLGADLIEGYYRPEQIVINVCGTRASNGFAEREVYAHVDGINGINASTNQYVHTGVRTSLSIDNYIGVYNEYEGRKQWFWNGALYSVLIYEKALDYSDIDIIANRLRPS